jgi:hypothetical protein
VYLNENSKRRKVEYNYPCASLRVGYGRLGILDNLSREAIKWFSSHNIPLIYVIPLFTGRNYREKIVQDA